MDVTSLPDAALLALVLDGPQPAEHALRAATELVGLPRWLGQALGVAGLVARYGIPPEWAARVVALYELADHRHRTGAPAVRSARDALLVLDELRRSPVEVIAALLLDPGYRPIGVRTVAMGSINRVTLLPRDVLAPAVREGAAAIVVAHNHPSGDPTPSSADRRTTEGLRLAADLFAIPVLDHLILAPRSSYSFAEREGWLTWSYWLDDCCSGGDDLRATAAAGPYHDDHRGSTPGDTGTRAGTSALCRVSLPPGPPSLGEHRIAQMFAMTMPAAHPDEERAAVLALIDASPRDWHRTAALILEAGSAARLLGRPAWTGLETFDTELADELAARVPEGALDEKAAELRRLAEDGVTVVTVLDEGYPVNLRFIYNLPPALYVRGTLQPEDARAIAIVGTRQASDEGLQRAAQLAAELAHHGVTVVSGLARGIDTAAHEAALAAGGRTVAVLGTGIESPIYPAENRDLAERLLEHGALVSQFRPMAPPTRFSFPMRNVVMSGMSAGTVVIEASSTSGAKMQARLALEHGKPVFLLDSLVTKQAWARDYAERRGARVVRSVDDIVAALTAMQTPAQQLSLV